MELKSEDWVFKIENKNQLTVIRALLESQGYSTQYCQLSDYPRYKYIAGDLDGTFDVTFSNLINGKEEVDYEKLLTMIVVVNEVFEEKIGDCLATYSKGGENVNFSSGHAVPFARIMELGELLDRTFIKNPSNWFLQIDNNPQFIDFLHNYIGSKGIENEFVSSGYTGYTAVIESSKNEFCMSCDPEGNEITILQFLKIVDEWQPNKSIKLTSGYDCEIKNNYIKVGCQTIEKEVAKEFIKKLKQFA